MMKKGIWGVMFTALLLWGCDDAAQEDAEALSTTDTVEVDSLPEPDTVVVDTVPPQVIPDGVFTGKYIGIQHGDIGDYVAVHGNNGEKRTFYTAFLDIGNPLIAEEDRFLNREISVGWKKINYKNVYDNAEIELDSMIFLNWGGFQKTIGEGGDYADPVAAFRAVQNGDTITFLPGTYRLRQGLELWGVNNVVIRGPETDTVTLVCSDKNDNVMWIVNAKNITLENLHCTHEQPAEGEVCTGNVINLDYATNVTIRNCDLNGCGAVGVYAFGAQNVRLNRNHIHQNSLWAVWWNGKGLLEATTEHQGLYFEQNTIENNGAENPILMEEEEGF